MTEISGPFTDKLVLVTGAGSGIGRATALAFARSGATVLACDLDLATARQTAALAVDRVVAYQVDVADERAMLALAELVAQRHGSPDVLVNNAGISHYGSVLDTTSAEWARVLEVNLWGVIHGCRAFGALMVARGRGGHIVNVSSGAAYIPSRLLAAYSTSKAAVSMLSDCLRAELAEHRIGVSTICPGVTNTNIVRTTTYSGTSAEEQERQRARTGRIHRWRNFPPERVAGEILRAVRHNRTVVPVSAEAKIARVLSRLAPGVLRHSARLLR